MECTVFKSPRSYGDDGQERPCYGGDGQEWPSYGGDGLERPSYGGDGQEWPSYMRRIEEADDRATGRVGFASKEHRFRSGQFKGLVTHSAV